MDPRLMPSKSYHRSKRVVAIVPAYNEAPRIAEVLRVLVRCPFDDIIVVDDGSTDDTAQVASTFNILVLRQENAGKGRAMDLGVKVSRADVIFFSDADVQGLSPEIIEEILQPVLSGEADMMVAACYRKIYFIRSLFWIIPLLSGERALTRELWEQIPAKYRDRFMIETALNFYARNHGQGFRFKVFNDLKHTVKEQKYGFWAGFKARLKMFYEVLCAQVSLLLERHK